MVELRAFAKCLYSISTEISRKNEFPEMWGRGRMWEGRNFQDIRMMMSMYEEDLLAKKIMLK